MWVRQSPQAREKLSPVIRYPLNGDFYQRPQVILPADEPHLRREGGRRSSLYSGETAGVRASFFASLPPHSSRFTGTMRVKETGSSLLWDDDGLQFNLNFTP
jgi:hypothetical protein